jgi:hypothetical protein
MMSLSVEKQFLEKLAQIGNLAKEHPVMDGAALVFRISQQSLICEVVVEVRFPGWTNLPFDDSKPSKQGRLWVYLQNVSDERVEFRYREFILTGGLKLPWTAGMELMANPYRTEMGEVLSWVYPITGSEDPELLASEIFGILKKCKTIVASSR